MTVVNHLSYSSVSQLLTCPMQWYITKTQKITPPPKDYMAFGTAVHRVIQYNALQGWRMSAKDMIDVYVSVYNAALPQENIQETKNYEYAVSLFTNDAIMSALRFIVVKHEHQIERKVTFRVAGVPLPIIGYIDILQDDGVPIDIKTSSTEWTVERAEQELQPLYYLEGLKDGRHGGKFVYVIIQKLSWGECGLQILHVQYHDWQETLYKHITSAWNVITANGWNDVTPPVSACRQCPQEIQFECAKRRAK